jgi:SAM-dependent methyltransferase
VSTVAFYDQLAPLYHLVYESWEAAVRGQAKALDSIIRSHLSNGPQRILDVACGIGTQSLGLAALGHRVTGRDISPAAVQRARREAASRGLSIEFGVEDMRNPSVRPAPEFDVVLCADNALPHLLSDDEIADALRCFRAALRPGGLCLITLRDYAALEHGGIQLKQQAIRHENGTRWILFQVWEWRDSIYDLHFYFVADDGTSPCRTHVFRSSYYALSVEHLIGLTVAAGFEQVRRIDDAFHQPVIAARRPTAA